MREGAVRPDYGGACTSTLVRGLSGRAPWVPEPVREAQAVVLLLVDGLGWRLIERHADLLPVLSSMTGGPITTVAPSTTTAALTSVTTGLPPAEHGVVGYRIAEGSGVLNVLRWSVAGGRAPDPERFQPRVAFDGDAVPVVTKAEFEATGFTGVYLRGAPFTGWHSPSSIGPLARARVEDGARFVYTYYGQADIVFHMHGLADPCCRAELSFVDRLVGDVLAALPPSVALAVSADHGHIAFEGLIQTTELAPMVRLQAGESRFRYLHAVPGAAEDLAQAAAERWADLAWVFTREQLVDEGWLGPRAPSPTVLARLGDVILAARAPIGFADPDNPGEARLLSGHGSLTDEEMLVPLLAARGAG